MSKRKDVYTELDGIFDCDEFIQSIRDGFKEVEDPRAADNRIYPIGSLLVMILCAIIAGANTITQIHEYLQLKIELFERLLGVSQAPSYSVFWWVITRMNPKHLSDTFISWIQTLPKEIKNQIIAIDGKRLDGVTHRQLVHLVSAWESRRGLVLGQIRTEEKSNEITAIPQLLKTIDVREAIVTIDAASCQKEILQQICNQGGNYLVALKGNQRTLYAEAQNFFDQAREYRYEEAACKVGVTIEKGNGRVEERQIVVTTDLNWLETKIEWTEIASLIEVTSHRKTKGETSEEKRYYISSLCLTPERAGGLIRGHWNIENHLHWSMDVVFWEDKCQVSTRHAPENLAIFRRMAQRLIKKDLGGTVGVAKKRRQAAWNDAYAVRLLSTLFKEDM